ncbi:MAG TPA: histidine kinase dimerization/phospho-acceptor domain-containing protein, partial [Phycisphaerae bacterium]|nr:histidine kinase dimerization/phospho-acceptor domain-containing protein [Phycisphaerae bacterium]
MGLADFGLFLALGSPELGTPSPVVVSVTLACGFGALGFAVGRLALARQRAARDAAIIERQLHQLEEAQRSLLQQEKLAALGRLAAGVAHEVRNPLGVIRASASMVQESFSPGEDSYRACEFICEEIDRLNALITALLSLSRPAEPRLASISPENLLDRALHLAGEALGSRGITVVHEGDGGGEMQGDPDLLSQVLLDLLLNAAEAVAEGGRVVVRLGGDREWVRMEVADDGPGVSPERVGQ